MKKLFILPAVIVALTACQSEAKRGEGMDFTDVKARNLTGAVRSVSQTSMPAAMDEHGDLKPVDTLGTNRDAFNRAGYITESEDFDKAGEVTGRVVMEYNDKNRRISSKTIDYLSEFAQGDKEGQGAPNSYEYDKAGFMVAQYVRDTAGNVTGKTTYRNNENGLPVETRHYEGSEMRLVGSVITKYDDKGRTTFESTIMDGMAASYHFTYDGQQRNPSVITANVIDGEGGRQVMTMHHEYRKYDKYGNWTECINHVVETDQYGMIVRKIDYYE